MAIPYGVAIFVRIITLALMSAGIVIQRKSHVLNDALPKNQRKNSLERPLWHLGFWLYVIFSVVGDLVAISTLPILVIAPLTTLLLFFNAIFSWYLLQETITVKGMVGTCVVAVCSAVLAVLLDVPNPVRDVHSLRDLFKSPLYISFCAVNLVLIFATFVALHFVKKRIRKRRNEGDVLKKERCAMALLWQTNSTLLAAHAIVYTKLTIDLLRISFQTVNQFRSGIGIIVLLLAGITALLQLMFFNFSLHWYSTLLTVPFGYSLGMILAFVNTLVYYDTFSLLNTIRIITVAFAIVGTVCGTFLLSL